MRIIENVALDTKNDSKSLMNHQSTILGPKEVKSVNINEMTDENGQPTKTAYQIAVNKLNELVEYSKKSSKFVFHENLDKYYVEVVDTKTQEVVKEIPPKELLDAYYEMQKLVGKMFDTKA